MQLSMTGLTPMLKTENLEETIAFYTKTLGFSIDSTMPDENGKTNWVSMTWGEAKLMFFSIEAIDDMAARPTMTGVLYFNPNDVKSLWENLKDKAPVEWELQVMPYGMCEFAIRDCNGYILTFGQDVKEKRTRENWPPQAGTC